MIWYKRFGVWRRLVARYLGVVEVVGSSPVTPTNKNKARLKSGFLFFLPHAKAVFSGKIRRFSKKQLIFQKNTL